MLASLLMLAAAGGSATVPVADDLVRVRNVARVSGAGDLILFKLCQPAVTLAPDELRRLVTNRLPGARVALLRQGAVRFVRKIAPRLRPVPITVPEITGVIAGQDMVLRTAVGPVMIERQVVTLQPSRPGKRIFVRTGDGAVVSARVEETP